MTIYGEYGTHDNVFKAFKGKYGNIWINEVKNRFYEGQGQQ